MIKAIIVDDESRARDLLQKILEHEFSERVKILDSVSDINSAVASIKSLKPDVVFLDIQMHEGTGFDLLKQINNIDFEVVFVTAHNEYAIQAIEFSALGYIMKPLRIAELKTVIDKLEKHLTKLKNGANSRVKVLIENYQDNQSIKKLIINHIEGFDVTPIKDIIRLEGDRNYTYFILSNGKRVLTSKTLGEYEDLLLDHGFYRIHQSTIVNLRHITKYKKGTGGKVEMTDGELFNVSRYRKQGFLNRFLGSDVDE